MAIPAAHREPGAPDPGLAADAFGPTPTLPGPVVTLAPLVIDHLDDYWAMMSEPENRRLTGTHGTVCIDDTRGWLLSRVDQRHRADHAIIDSATGGFVGEVVLNEFSPEDASASFRIVLAGPGLYGRGYGSEATRMAIAYGFDTVGLHRISLEVFDFNPLAQRVYQKCGFRCEGRKREVLRDADGWHDAIMMGILVTDPRNDQGDRAILP